MARYTSRWVPPAAGPAAALLGLLSLGGCGMFDHNAPDEFSVTTRAPLVIPNDFSLPPPRPGVERAQEQPRLQAQAALVPSMVLSNEAGPDSPGQQALLKAAGPPAPANIRQRIDQEAKHDTGGGLSGSLMFWKPPPPPGTAINPQQEATRLRQRAAQSSQAATPKPAKGTGLFDWLF